MVLRIGPKFKLKDPLGLGGDKLFNRMPGLGAAAPERPVSPRAEPAAEPVQRVAPVATSSRPAQAAPSPQPLAPAEAAEMPPAAAAPPPMDPGDWNDLVNTVIAEAGGEGPQGMAAVAAVIRNRAERRGKTPGEIVRAPKQFEGYYAPGDGAKKAQQDARIRAQAEQILAGVFSGEMPDPTGGADHFHADSVSPGWASKMPQTTKIGGHTFYTSKPGAKGDSAAMAFTAPEPSGTSAPFGIMDRPPGDPSAKGLARLAPPERTTSAGDFLKTRLLNHSADHIDGMQPALQTRLAAMFEAAPPEIAADLGIYSGARSVERQTQLWENAVKKYGSVSAARKWVAPPPGVAGSKGSQHNHGNAADLAYKGQSLAKAPKHVVEWVHANAAKYGLAFPLGNEPWHIETAEARGGEAPKDIPEGGARRGGIIRADADYKPADSMGLYAGRPSPLEGIGFRRTPAEVAVPQSRPEEPTAAPVIASPEVPTAPVDGAFADLEAKEPGRFKVITAAEYEQWKTTWDKQNQSTGWGGDAARLLKSGADQTALAVREAVGMIPAIGPGVVAGIDMIDEWARGDDVSSKQFLSRDAEKQAATLTPGTAEARDKNWWDSERMRPGPAWADPRSYIAGGIESVPGMAVTMGPSMALARGAFTRAIGAGLGEKAAAAAAAKTAAISGAILEGLLGGGQSAGSVREQIQQLPRKVLEQSTAVQELMKGGMTYEKAVAAVAEDGATKAFVLGGVATGIFGGMGDRALARILSDGVGGGIVKRIVLGGAKGAVGEGVFEEAPQSAGQQIAENLAVGDVDPNRNPTEGVGEAVAGGLAVGATMGGGIGAAGGAARPAPVDAVPAGSPAPAPLPPARGPLGKAVEKGERTATQKPGASFTVNDPPIDGMAAGAMHGETVTIAGDQANVPNGMQRVIGADGAPRIIGDRLLVPTPAAPPAAKVQPGNATSAAPAPSGAPPVGSTVQVTAEGMKPFMATIDSYEDGEAVVFDSASGEVYQVPTDTLTQIAGGDVPSVMDKPKTVDVTNDELTAAPVVNDTKTVAPVSEASKPVKPVEEQAVPAEQEPILPLEPIASTTTSELPPASEQKPALERFPTPPQPGERVLVDAPGGRFAGRVERYEGDGADTEAVVTTDDGTSLQVPVDKLYVSKLTKKDVEQQDLAKDPPVARDPVSKEVTTARPVAGKTVVMPDENHARLFDLGKDRMQTKVLSGKSRLDMDGARPAEQAKLAEAFGVSVEALGQMADDYRYRVERAGKEARSALPVKMHPVNPQRLKQWQADARKREGAQATDDLSVWWDGELTAPERKAILDKAGVKRSEKMQWGSMSAPIKAKLAAQRTPAADLVPDAGTMIETPENVGLSHSSPTNEGGEINMGPPDGPQDVQTVQSAAPIEAAANVAATSPLNDRPEPSQAQKEAGNYKLGHARVGGLDLSIENPAGSERKGVDKGGKAWSVKMKSHYGYIKGTVGKDKDHIDAFVKPGTAELADDTPVFVINQVAGDRFDEHKVMLGFGSKDDATAAYQENYAKGWNGLGTIGETTLGGFKSWLESGETRSPFPARPESVKRSADSDVAGKTTATNPAVAPTAVPASTPKRAKVRRLDRLENYFRPGREVPAYGGTTDRVISFDGGGTNWTVRVAEVKGDGSLGRERLHTTAPSERDLARWERANPVPVVDKKVGKSAPVAPEQAAEPVVDNKKPAEFAGNKLFTADKVAAARARLKSKLGQINSGIDPEVLIDGLTIAGAYIEAGVRDFATYAKQMSDDFGPSIRPYLLSFWEGARNYPGLDNAGMTAVDESAKLHAALNRELPAEVAAAVGSEVKAPKVRAKKTGQNGDRTLIQDFGTEHIDAYTEEGEAVKEAFLKDATSYLRAVSDVLTAEGWQAPDDTKGRPLKAVSRNPGGIAGSGEVSLSLRHPELDKSLWAQVGGSALRGVVPTTQSGVALVYRVGDGPDRYATRATNRWAPVGLSARDLGAIMLREAGGSLRKEDLSRQAVEAPNEPAKLGKSGASPLEGAPSEAVRGAERSRDAGKQPPGGGEPDLFGSEPARAERLPAGRGVADGQGELSPAAARGRDDAGANAEPDASDGDSDAVRAARDADRHVDASQSEATPAADRPVDYALTDADELGAGGAKTKFRQNVAAIRLLRTLTEENRPATRDEQSVLAKWVGWGGLRAAFAREDGTINKGWDKEAAELKELLTPEEFKAAESSTRNAHYTSPEVVRAMWEIARRLGFKGGQVLEPSVGAGNFVGLMPGQFRESARVTGVELDHITGGIAKNLYPHANIKAPVGFQVFDVPDGYFDLAIGNPPFGSERLYDADRRELNKFSIHNYFFAKSVEGLRPGGVLAMVVTNYFLDATDAKARAYIAARADLLGAIRLPNNAFMKNAGTEVTTDIIILQKREPGTPASDLSWVEVAKHTDKEGREVPLNRYFRKHPEMMLGEFGAYGTMYRGDEAALVARPDDDLSDLLRKATLALPEAVMPAPGAAVAIETIAVPTTAAEAQIGSLFVSPEGDVWIRKPDSLGEAQAERVSYPFETAKERVVGMVRVRDAFARLRRAQIDARATDEKLDNLRKLLNQSYDAFAKKHGPINGDANKRLFRDDPTWPQIAALEEGFDKGISAAVAKVTGEAARAASARKAPIFTKRTQQPYSRPTKAASAKDALATVLADVGRVDLEAMSTLYRKSEGQIIDELGTLLYQTPAGGYETADQYLSGNVKAKLAEASRAAESDPQFRRNVAALSDVIPADIEAVDIDVKPGAPWLPANHVADFVNHIAEAKGAKAFYSRANAKWSLTVPSASAAADLQWTTNRTSMSYMLEAVMNAQAITIYDKTSDGKMVLNQPETDAANEKAAKLKAEWRRWIWDEDARREQLHRLYNDTFNTDVLRKFDGSHLSLPGKVGDDIITLRPHQKNFIWRVLQSSTTLADHVVGSGKTFELIASIMEMRRMGIAKKPMLTVPNHLVGQWAADFIKLYPGAKVLAATKRDFEAENRKKLFARVTTGDWDVVIVAHSSFGRIGVAPEFEKRFIEGQMADIEASMKELRENTGEKSRSVAQLAKWRETMASKLQRLLDAGAKDDGMTFDEMGVDALLVDEAHEFKNLAFATSMTRVAGLGNAAGSQKAADLYMKVLSVMERTGGRNIIFATGTPLSNTMAEMFTVQRYLDGEGLKNLGVAHFDAWARVFGEVVSDWELSPSGQYKMNSRFAKFVNMPELMQRYLSFADVITNDDIKAQLAAIGKTLPLPNVKGGKPQNVVVERSADQARYIGVGTLDQSGNMVFPKGSLVFRAENLPKKAEKGADNMLKVMSDARKAALDMRLIDPSYPDAPGSKVHDAADNILRIYRAWDAKKGTQLVFIDLSTPKKAKAKEEARIRDLMKRAEAGEEAAQTALDNMSPDEFMALDGNFSVYDDLREKLIDRGVPAAEIAFIHDANTDAQKEELFGKVRSGRIRILLGSTAKMGAGTNVQNRLVALHHLDAPWRPSDLEQRDGRGIRQGNELYGEDPDGFEIEILRYATKNTLDARQWQTIEGKARFIQQMRKGGMTTREVEDIAGEASNAAEMKAAASGNPLILEEMDLRQKLRKLEGQASEHDREQHRIKARLSSMRNEIMRNDARMADAEADAATAGKALGGDFSATIGGATVDKPKDMGAAVLSIARKMLEQKDVEADIGTYGGFKVALEYAHSSAFTITLQGKQEHDVFIDDVKAADDVGTGMRIANTVRRMVNEPRTLAERNTELTGQIPALERQIAEWPDAAKLQEAAARHAEVMTALKPKPQQAAPAAPAEEIRKSIDSDAGAYHDADTLRAELAAGAAGGLIDGLVRTQRLTIGTAASLKAPEGATAWTDDAGRMFMVADRVRRGRATAVLMHEAFHSGRDSLFAGDTWKTLVDRLGQLYRQFDRSSAGAKAFLEAARARVANAESFDGPFDQALTAEEFGAYAIEEYEAAPGAAKRWVDDVVGAIKAWVLRKFGRQVGELTPAQLRSLAIAALRDDTTVASPQGKRFSRAGTGARAVTENRIVEEVRGRLTDFQPAALAAVPLNYFPELAQPNMASVGEYLRVKRLLDAYRGKKHAAADVVAQSWLKFVRLGFGKGGKAKAAQLAEVMHESTLAGVDPSKTDRETASLAGYADLRAKFLALPPAGRELFVTVRDSYTAQADELDKILLDNVRKAHEIAQRQAERMYREELERIDAAKMSKGEKAEAKREADAEYLVLSTKAKWSMKARLTKMRIAFEASRVQGPYFPLARYGRYFVTVRDVDGSVLSFSRREREEDRKRLVADMKKAYPTATVETGVTENGSEIRQAMDPRIIAEIEQIIGGAGLDSAAMTTVLDQIWQRYLTTMPDLSTRKRFIHRKGTAGFDADALRAFSSHMFHAAHQMGRLKYGLELQELTNSAADEAGKSDDAIKGMTLVNELKRRHDWVMQPTGHWAAQVMNSTAFVWYLAASPAAALVNTSQTFMMGIPILGARFGGMMKASAAILRAARDSAAGYGSVGNANLAQDEKRALDAFQESGLIDRTQSHDLAGVGETGVDYSPLRAKVMGILSWAFHRTEVWNREVTALAAYRMARAAGQDVGTAIDTAHDLTWKTHFDYSNSSRPWLMQNDFAKVALVFRSYSINMLYRVFRDIHQSLKGASPQARREARHQLAGLVGMMALSAGVRGTVFFSAAMILAGWVLGDDDDPMDFEESFKKSVTDLLGPELGGVVLNGVPGHYLGLDLTNRIGMPDLWWRSPGRDLQGKDEFMYWVAQTLGASVSMLGDWHYAYKLASDGSIWQAIERASPKFVRDPMKAWRYSEEGVATARGDQIVERDRIGSLELLAQAIGFTPAEISETWDRTGALNNAESRVMRKRASLLNRYATAHALRDDEARHEALDEIKAFNRVAGHKAVAITPDTIRRSLRTRARNAAKREDGALISNPDLGRDLRSRLGQRIYAD